MSYLCTWTAIIKNRNQFFSELHFLLYQVINKHENIKVVGDLIIDTTTQDIIPIITYIIYETLFP